MKQYYRRPACRHLASGTGSSDLCFFRSTEGFLVSARVLVKPPLTLPFDTWYTTCAFTLTLSLLRSEQGSRVPTLISLGLPFDPGDCMLVRARVPSFTPMSLLANTCLVNEIPLSKTIFTDPDNLLFVGSHFHQLLFRAEVNMTRSFFQLTMPFDPGGLSGFSSRTPFGLPFFCDASIYICISWFWLWIRTPPILVSTTMMMTSLSTIVLISYGTLLHLSPFAACLYDFACFVETFDSYLVSGAIYQVFDRDLFGLGWDMISLSREYWGAILESFDSTLKKLRGFFEAMNFFFHLVLSVKLELYLILKWWSWVGLLDSGCLHTWELRSSDRVSLWPFFWEMAQYCWLWFFMIVFGVLIFFTYYCGEGCQLSKAQDEGNELNYKCTFVSSYLYPTVSVLYHFTFDK